MPRPPNPEVRARLIEQGQLVVSEAGFNGTGVQEIATAANVPKGSFYNYFDTKEAFASAMLQEYWGSIETRHGHLLTDTRVKPIKRIEKFFKLLAEDHAMTEFKLGCLIGNLSLELSNTSADVRSTLKGILATWESSIAACIKEAQQAGDLASNTPASQIASLIIESWEGAILRCKVEQSGKACDRFLNISLKRLLE